MTLSSKTKPLLGLRSFSVEFTGVFFVFFLYANSLVPAINEPHYWTKAAHFWNNDFGKGDLFLESGDAHWLFFVTFGFLTTIFSLEWAVWIGRLLTWLALAAGWTSLGRAIWSGATSTKVPDSESRGDSAASISRDAAQPWSQALPPALFATSWSALWLAAMHWGHWAGEWVVGGCESKGIAYSFVFFGLSLAIRSRWTFAWLMLGAAAAFHIVVGIWVIGSVLVASVVLREPVTTGFTSPSWIRRHRVGWALCCIGVVVGAVPALLIDWGTAPEVATQSAVKQAYLRLGHHLAPSRFSSERWNAFEWHLLAMVALLLTVCRSRVNSLYATPSPQNHNESNKFLGNLFVTMLRDGREAFRRSPHGVRFVAACGLAGFLAALVGLLIDTTLSSTAPDLAAKILRFYWFRWNDVALAMMSSLILSSLAYGLLQYQPSIRRTRWIAISLATLTCGLLLWSRIDSCLTESIPAGDKAHFVAKSDDPSIQIRQYQDWIHVCDWIRTNTDQNGLWLTPRRQQSFKWHTGRAELACWKDAPQNAVALVDWGKRLSDAYRFDSKKVLLPTTDGQLWALHKKYGIRYVLLDRRVLQQSPPLLPILYPGQDELNESFAVFEFPQDEVTFPPKH